LFSFFFLLELSVVAISQPSKLSICKFSCIIVLIVK
jgi:hypothetical protein